MDKTSFENSMKSTSSGSKTFKKYFTSTQINESPKTQSINMNQSPIVSSGNKKRLRPAHSMAQTDKVATPNLKSFEYNSKNTKFKKPSNKNLNKDWVCVDDDISYIKLDNSSSGQEDLGQKSDDDFEIEFSRIKKEKQRKLIDETNKASSLLNSKEDKEDEKENEDEEDDLDFDQDTDTQIDPSKYVKIKK